jgi:hypothetical protein
MNIDPYLDDAGRLLDVTETVAVMRELVCRESGSDFDAFRRSAEFVAERYSSLGLSAEIMEFPCDGQTCWQMWTSPMAFTAGNFSCRVYADPGHDFHYGKEAGTLTPFMGSGFTGAEGIVADLVEVSTPADLESKEIGGKIVFTASMNPAALRAGLLARGAVAVLSAFADNRALNAQHIKWVNAWDAEPDGWMATLAAARQNLPGASISPEDGDVLHALLAQGVQLRSRIVSEGGYGEGTMPSVFAAFPGEGPDDCLLTGHLFEPGLFDIASGVAVSLAASQILVKLRDCGRAMPFRRGLRAFHSQECYGVLGLKSFHPERLDGAFAHLNLDMVGCPATPVNLHRGLDASSGFSTKVLDLFLARSLARHGIPLRSRQDFEINCSVLADLALGGIPTSLIAQENPQWHCSGDRFGSVPLDEDVLAAISAAVAAWLAFLASADASELKWLVEMILKEALAGAVKAPDGRVFLGIKEMEMKSLAVLLPEGDREPFLHRADMEFESIRRRIPALREIAPLGSADDIARSRRTFPRARLGGPPTQRFFTPEQIRKIGSPRWSNTHLVLKSWADGTRSVYDIARFAISELGEASAAQLTLPFLNTFFEIYAEQGIVAMRR